MLSGLRVIHPLQPLICWLLALEEVKDEMGLLFLALLTLFLAPPSFAQRSYTQEQVSRTPSHLTCIRSTPRFPRSVSKTGYSQALRVLRSTDGSWQTLAT